MDKSPNEPRSMSKVPTYMFLVTIRIIFLIIRFSQQKKKKKELPQATVIILGFSRVEKE